jgi:hypothetical protein
MFPYPFNKYGFDFYVADPIKQFFAKSRIIKTYVCDWDCVNVHQVVIEIFENYCKHYPLSFVNQWVIEQKAFEKDGDMCNAIPEEEQYDWKNFYLRLHDLEQYVTVTRKNNQALLKQIEDWWHEHTYFGFYIKQEEGKEQYKDMDAVVDWELDYDTLIIKDWKVVDKATVHDHFNPMDIEHALDKLDAEVAKQIIEHKDGIWD